MGLISEQNLEAVLAADIDMLVYFDDHGLLIGPDESLEHYVKRLRTLDENIAELISELKDRGSIELLDMEFRHDDLIPDSVYKSSQLKTRALFDFAIDWIPGFFTNTHMGFLFAGCAMYAYDDFFAVFVIRRAFKNNEKWIIYSRTELIAHELCHIAHIGYQVKNYEEIFAYQTADSLFRRLFGGVLRTSSDTYLLLAVVGVLVVSQVVNISARAPAEWNDFPMPLIFGMVMCSILYVFVRYLFFLRRFRLARRNLGRYFGDSSAMPVLFRCSEQEIRDISQLSESHKLGEWLRNRMTGSYRWKTIMKKYS